MVSGVSKFTPPAGRTGFIADVFADFFVVLEPSSLFVFEAPDDAFVSAEPFDFAAPVLPAGADVIVESLTVAEAFAAVLDALAVAVGLGVSEAAAEHMISSARIPTLII